MLRRAVVDLVIAFKCSGIDRANRRTAFSSGNVGEVQGKRLLDGR